MRIRIAAGTASPGRAAYSRSMLRRDLEAIVAAGAVGRANAAIAARLGVTEKVVSKHINAIFTKLDLHPSDHDHRRVLAYLNG